MKKKSYKINKKTKQLKKYQLYKLCIYTKSNERIEVKTNKQINLTPFIKRSSISLIFISDTHFGNIEENVSYIEEVYRYAIHNNINYIVHLGDLIDGFMEELDRNQYLIKDNIKQIAHVCESYPYDNRIKNFILFGNHDILSIVNDSIPLESILIKRNDFDFCGYRTAYLKFFKQCLALIHPIKKVSQANLELNPFLYMRGHSHTFKINESPSSTTIYTPPLCNINQREPGFIIIKLNFDNQSLIDYEVEHISLKTRKKTKKLIRI